MRPEGSKRFWRSRNGRRGYTLVELLLTVVLLSIMAIPVIFILHTTMSAQETILTESDLTLRARLAMDTIINDLFTATSINTATTTSIDFNALKQDSNGNQAATRIAYSWNGTVGGSITRTETPQTGSPVTTTVTDRVQNWNLRYFQVSNGNYVELAANFTAAHCVQVDVDIASGNYHAGMTSSARLRNIS